MAHSVRHIVRILSALILVAAAGCTGTTTTPPEEAPKVGVQHPKPRSLEDVEEFNGWLQPNAKVDVRARVRGHIYKVHFDNGDKVKKDQLLFELDPRPFKADVAAAKEKYEVYKSQKEAMVKEAARLRELEKKGGASKRQVEKADADVDSLNAQIRASQVAIDRAELDFEYSRVTA